MIIGEINKNQFGQRKIEVHDIRGFNCVPSDGRQAVVPMIRLGGPAIDRVASDDLIDEESLGQWLLKDISGGALPGALTVAEQVIVDVPVDEDTTLHIAGLVGGRLWALSES